MIDRLISKRIDPKKLRIVTALLRLQWFVLLLSPSKLDFNL